jgi:tRNA threonylcarbamoyladenosine modification (KEOPS) complex  Pcc1 subunit
LKAKAEVRLPFASDKQLAAVLGALNPEVQRQIGTRSKVALAAEGQTLVLVVEAQDTVALRAALNAYLRWIASTLNVLEMLEKKT